MSISNDYYLKAINLCDSLAETIDLAESETLKGSCYGAIAFNYNSLSVEPELSKDYCEKAILCHMSSLKILKDSVITTDIKKVLMQSVCNLLMSDLMQYSNVCTDYDIYYGDYVVNIMSNVLNSMGEFLTEKEKYENSFTAYQKDFEQNRKFGYRELCRLRIDDMEELIKNNHKNVKIWDYYNLAEDYFEINDTLKALSYYNRVIEDYQKSDYSKEDLLSNAAYWYSHKAISEINGDKNWISTIMKEIVDQVEMMDSEKRIKELYKVIQLLSSASYDEEMEELRNNLIEIDRRIIKEYNEGMDFDNLSDVYYDLLTKCLMNKQYNILKDYYKECAYAGMQSAKNRQYNMPSSVYETFEGKGLGELLSLTFPNNHFDTGVIFNSLLFRKNAELRVSMSLSELISGTTDSLLVKKYQRVEKLKRAIRNSNSGFIEDMGRTLTLREAANIAYKFEEEISCIVRFMAENFMICELMDGDMTENNDVEN